jgi:hypothetical protein
MLSIIGALSFLGCVSQQTETNKTDDRPSSAIAPAVAAMPERNVSLELDPSLKTKVTNVDVVKRHVDRSEMTIGIEYEYRDEIPNAKIGVEILLESSPGVSRFFESRLADVGRRRNFALFDVKFRPPPQAGVDTLTTDKVIVFLEDGVAGQRYNLAKRTMLLAWKASNHAEN